ncbi:MAG: UDP-N-acetylmuramate dehydrogenase [Thermotogae bacterium]|nr:MAG: UDP-N-acetylmuramate dehydrogenase [Thermotogota bacterium]
MNQIARCQFRFNEPLSAHTSIKIGGPASIFVVPQSIDTLLCCIQQLDFLSPRIIGNGTNVIPSDEGIDCVIKTSQLTSTVVKDNTIESECGTPLRDLCKLALENELQGLEFAWGIPGTIGGAVVMNAGAFGSQMSEIVEEVLTFDGENIFALKGDALRFSYRNSVFREKGWLVLKVKIRLKHGIKEKIRGRMRRIMKQRLESQPLDFPSAGSVFKRPTETFYVGKAIEDLGLKGYAIGGAEISKKHAGFIINRGGATAEDVKRLISCIQQKVYTHFGVLLEPEVILW